MRILAALTAALVVAPQAVAQIVPDVELDVYDANYDLVGRFLGPTSRNEYLVSVRTNDQEGVALAFAQLFEPDASGNVSASWLGPRPIYTTPNCVGTPYRTLAADPVVHLTSEGGYLYAAAPNGAVLRWTPQATVVSVQKQSEINTEGLCIASSGLVDVVPVESVGAVSTAFPFHLAEVPPIAPLLPTSVWVGLAVAMGVLGAGTLARSRFQALVLAAAAGSVVLASGGDAEAFPNLAKDDLLAATSLDLGTVTVMLIDHETGDRRVVSGFDGSATVGAGPPIIYYSGEAPGISQSDDGSIWVATTGRFYMIDPYTGDRTLVSGCPGSTVPCQVPLVGSGPEPIRNWSIEVVETPTLVAFALPPPALGILAGVLLGLGISHSRRRLAP